MGYTHRGAEHDFVDAPTDYGKGIADQYDTLLRKRQRRAEELFRRDLRQWEHYAKVLRKRNARLTREYHEKLTEWENSCKDSFSGFLKKLLKINKPKLELTEISPRPHWDYGEYMSRV